MPCSSASSSFTSARRSCSGDPVIRASALFLATLALGTTAALLRPGPMLMPGRLLPGHAALRDDCLACHVLLEGVRRERCTRCHAPESIGVKTVAGGPAPQPREPIASLHRRIGIAECAVCHPEHAGRLEGGRAARFSHEGLPSEIRASCTTCHEGERPVDALHRAVDGMCAACHDTARWKPARFDHGRRVAGGPACAACHRGDTPGDELHASVGEAGACDACHSTSAWKPATFDHGRYFRFDRHHPARCSDCHAPGGGFKAYSCTGCHEHSPERIAAKHREEGITDVSNCAGCHPSGDEHDARRTPGTGPRERGGDRKHDGDEDD